MADSGTYDEATLARRYAMAQKLMESGRAPIKHWAEGLGNMSESLLGGYQVSKLDAERKAEKEQGKADLAGMFGLPAPAAATAAPEGGFQKLAALLSGGGAAASSPAVAAPVGPDQASYPPPPAAPPAPTTFRPGIAALAAPDATLPRGLRNNNPLNIEAGDFTKGQPGFVGSDGRFARFETPEQGTAAASKLLDTYESKYGLNTPAGIIGRWAPQGENNSAAYAATVAKKLGIGPNDPITPEMRPRLIAAMSEVENGRPAAVPQAAALTAPSGDATLPPGATPAQGALPTAEAVRGSSLASLPLGTRQQIAAGMNSTNPTARAMASALLQKALAPPTHIDLGNKIGIMDNQGNIIRTIDKGEPNKGPEYGVINKDQFGREQYGFRDPRTQSVKPYKPEGSEAAPTIVGPDGKVVTVQPGQDPKVIQEAISKAQAAQALPPDYKEVQKMREDFVALPAYKNLAQAAPIYNSMREAAGRDTKAADLNMVYGLGKIFDPTSVVREGELQMANAAQGVQERLNGIIAQIQSKGGLTPAGREALMAEAHGRVTSYKAEFDRDASRFKGIAERSRVNPQDVIPEFGSFEPWAAPKAKGDETAPPTGVDAKIWQHMTPEERALWK